MALGLLMVLGLIVLPPWQSAALAHRSGADQRIGRADCALLGRTFLSGRGCSRDDCVPGAHLANPSQGAEVCALGVHPFGVAVDYRRCAALHRRWLAQVNWCASNPNRSRATIPRARQCVAPATTYVTLLEREGWYDQCVSPGVVRAWSRLARREHTTLEHEASVRSSTLCSFRPRHVFADGVCVPGIRTDVQQGGTLLVGDSIAWRGTDELGRLRRDFTIDGQPSRRLGQLKSRLDWFRQDHGDPTGLIIELGTNADHETSKTDLRRILESLPRETLVMLVLPYRHNSHAPPAIQPSSTRYASWMRQLAAGRQHTCVADWRTKVRRLPALLVDGVHPTSAAESAWARWVSRTWHRCR